ncbi:MAG TPA: transglutaminase-like domain-containing protein [Planctomycetaceae bacterium]|nr:transglutaminase-like domain-containing protein [Planctomycetaceae bacterium]
MRRLAGMIFLVGQAASLPGRADEPQPEASAAFAPDGSEAVPGPRAGAADSALRYFDARTYRARFAVTVRAARSGVRNVVATCPVPVDWPEQQVQLVSETRPAQAAATVAELPGLGAMLVVRVPALPAGASVTVERVYEITRSKVELTRDPAGLVVPDGLPRELRAFLKPAPGFDDRGRRVEKLAEALREPGDTAWATTRRYFDWVRQNVEYREGEFRGPLAALDAKAGDCEDMTALFVALCRSAGIPARGVWVEGHAYPEFYLADAQGGGWWIPAQVSGPEWFGTMADYQPILQKGDRARDPIRRRDGRYIAQTARAIGGPVELSVTRTILDMPGPAGP